MRKLLTITTLLFISGCGQTIIFDSDISSMQFNGINILENDFNEVNEALQEIKFSCDNKKRYDGQTLSVTTKTEIINFNITDEYYIEYYRNNKYCHAQDIEKVKNLTTKLNSITKKYESTDFYTINFLTNYDETNANTIIKLDKDEDYIIIDTTEDLMNFNINEIEFNNDEFREINLLYSNSKIKKGQIVIRNRISDIPSFRFSFENKYGYKFIITPTYSGNTGEISFITEIVK